MIDKQKLLEFINEWQTTTGTYTGMERLKQAIESGELDKVCKWKWVESDRIYSTECDDYSGHNEEHCPHCGGRVEE